MSRAIRLIVFNIAVSFAILLTLEAISRWISPTELPDPLVTENDATWRDTRRYVPWRSLSK